MARVKLSNFPLGINTEPVKKGDWLAASDLENLQVDFATGHPELRRGNVPLTEDVHLQGERIAQIFVNTPARQYERIFRYGNNESYAHIGERLIVSGRGSTRWYDTSQFREYEFGIVQPPPIETVIAAYTDANGVSFPLNYLNINEEYRSGTNNYNNNAIRTFLITYLFRSTRFAFATQFADPILFDVGYNYNAVDQNIATSYLMPLIPLNEAPSWADEVEIYISDNPVDLDAAFVRLINNNNRIRVTSFDSLPQDTPFTRKTRFTGVAGAALNIRTAFDVAFSAGDIGGTNYAAANISLSSRSGRSIGQPDAAVPAHLNLEHLLLYAGRLWAYDSTRTAIVFSEIDGNGVSQYDNFPVSGAIPHQINVDREVVALASIPNNGGIYVFYRDGIQTIRGQSIITGLFSTDVEPFTDLDASGGIPDFGTLSPKSISNFRNTLTFLGSDRRLYQIVGTQVKNIGRRIQRSLDALTELQLPDVAADVHDDKLYLSLVNDTYVYDFTRDYWTRYDYGASDVFSSRQNDNLLAILNGAATLLDDPNGETSNLRWKWVSQDLTMPDIVTFCGVYVQCSPPYRPLDVRVTVDGAVAVDATFTPAYANRFLRGFYGRGTRVIVELSGTGPPPEIDGVELEFN